MGRAKRHLETENKFMKVSEALEILVDRIERLEAAVFRLQTERSGAAKPCPPSASGCSDARASSNHDADSSPHCADEKLNPPPYKCSNCGQDFETIQGCLIHKMDCKAAGAAPSGQRAGRRNDQAHPTAAGGTGGAQKGL